jgi:transcription elongation factor Elf1
MQCRGHLYRYHRIFQCPRCKVLEKSANDLEERHTLAVKACELNLIQPAEGITGNIEKKLRSRKKTHKGQSETERWQEMYRILFPNEGVPSPCKLFRPKRQWCCYQ